MPVPLAKKQQISNIDKEKQSKVLLPNYCTKNKYDYQKRIEGGLTMLYTSLPVAWAKLDPRAACPLSDVPSSMHAREKM